MNAEAANIITTCIAETLKVANDDTLSTEDCKKELVAISARALTALNKIMEQTK